MYSYKIPYNIKTFSRSDRRCFYTKKSTRQRKQNSNSKQQNSFTIYANGEEWNLVFDVNNIFWK